MNRRVSDHPHYSEASAFNSSISLTHLSIIFQSCIITITTWARSGGNSPLLVTVCVPPAGLWSAWICETLTVNPFIKPVKQGWQMRLHIPKMPTIFKAMGEWWRRQRMAPPGRHKVQATSDCIILKFWGETLSRTWWHVDLMIPTEHICRLSQVPTSEVESKYLYRNAHWLEEGFGYTAASYMDYIWLSHNSSSSFFICLIVKFQTKHISKLPVKGVVHDVHMTCMYAQAYTQLWSVSPKTIAWRYNLAIRQSNIQSFLFQLLPSM